MKKDFKKLTIEVYKNGKLINELKSSQTEEEIKAELIEDLLQTYFNKKRNITECNYYSKIKVTYTEYDGKDRYKTIRIYE